MINVMIHTQFNRKTRRFCEHATVREALKWGGVDPKRSMVYIDGREISSEEIENACTLADIGARDNSRLVVVNKLEAK